LSPKNKGGRPYADNPRDRRIELRLTKDEFIMLDWCCQITGKNRSEVARNGILETFEKLQNRSGTSRKE